MVSSHLVAEHSSNNTKLLKYNIKMVGVWSLIRGVSIIPDMDKEVASLIGRSAFSLKDYTSRQGSCSWGKLKFRSVDNILYEEKLIPYNFKTGSSKVAIAKWIKPKGQLKLNIDASFSPDGAAGGAIMRNERGEMLFALCFPLSADSSLEAELKAIVTATKWALSSGYGDFVVESDASRAVELISAKREGRWSSLVQEMALSTSQT
ncbi:unnamed protein product [Cuscuta epithymum]|uniref:RNase H type-1 domain-containing protein n=1 Tax=Cuscuta epithymum TaxID=186058 RepID=A0AAV0G8K5_9ASTE|nr:unnamed protein product [Cuscuta epithymum]